MRKIKLKLLCLLLVPFALFLHYLFSIYPHASESFYSLTLNKAFIQSLSKITGLFPFSLSELLIYGIVPLCVSYIIYILWRLYKDTKSWHKILLHFILNTLAALSILYFLFMSMWGFNYLRPHFGETIGIDITKHSTFELAELYTYLIEETNHLSEQTSRDKDGYMVITNGYRSVFERAHLGYNEAAKLFPSLAGNYGRPKPILTSEVMNYTGIAGIYFPFTAEANVNISVLDLSIPATTMHEMAHQRGYANEDEANFIAFVTCKLHPDIDFKYSGYLLALTHTAQALAQDNPSLLQELNRNLSKHVIEDIGRNHAFWKQYEGKVENISSKMNDAYLKVNGISDGTKSYGRMVDLLLGYYTVYVKE
ncbi:DUF3810 domain-containing protein [Cellulosilyticum sp. I15G10I2]|uniref:DUF3810 domain-containing protein n=1 Tax=Cellulosilyticum sp. I15G10I2 TaxID=1892843 RepID=UPI00085C0D59|nr:DUF3810 domain-containing protein [Cellulosilyticum sp. I15G10I2]